MPGWFRWYSNERFQKHKREQRALAQIADDLLGPDRTKVAVFGDGGFSGAMKGIGPAPVVKIRDYVARHGKVVLVPEFRTTKVPCVLVRGLAWLTESGQVCSLCHHDLQRSTKHYTDRGGKYRNDFASMHCNTSDHSWTWNRDGNAAWNIALIFYLKMHGIERPACFSRRR